MVNLDLYSRNARTIMLDALSYIGGLLFIVFIIFVVVVSIMATKAQKNKAVETKEPLWEWTDLE